MENTARQIFKILDRKKWKTTHNISNELDMIVLNFMPILIKGSSRGIFSYDAPNKWKLCKKADLVKFEAFCEEIRSGIDIPEITIFKYLSSNRKKIVNKTNNSKKKNKKKIIQVHMSGDGFNSGKKNLYDGPVGKYFSDPNYEKRFWD